jgi:predicted DNA-binding ribbon-helix-helix protein
LIHVNAALQHLCLATGLVGMTPVQSAVKKRSVMVGGRKTSISLEDEFWDTLNLIARTRNTSLSSLMESIATERPQKGHQSFANLSSAVRVFVLDYYRKNSRDFTSD